MSEPPTHRGARLLGLDPLILAGLCGVISAVGYTAANIYLRALSEDSNPVWVSCVKAMPTLAVACLLLAGRRARGLGVAPPWRVALVLVATGLFMQLGGNVAFQWSLGVIGMALCVPLVFGSLIVAGALCGRIWLGEGLTVRAVASMGILIVAVAVLSLGAESGSRELLAVPPASAALVLAAVGGASLAGCSYAICNVVVRRFITTGVPLPAALAVLSATGVVGLGVLSMARIGWEGVAATTAGQWRSMLAAGAFNALAFFTLAVALRSLSVVRVNLLNASQVAMCAVAGVVWFREPATTPLLVGVGLTLAGLVLMDRRKRPAAAPPAPAVESVAAEAGG